MELSFNAGLVSLIAGSTVILIELGFLVGKKINDDLTSNIIFKSTFIIVGLLAILGTFVGGLNVVKNSNTTMINKEQLGFIIDLEAKLLRVQTLNLLEKKLNNFEKVKEEKDEHIRSFKKSVTDFTIDSRYMLYRLNFKLPNGEYLNTKMEAIYPIESMLDNFDNMQVIFFDEKRTKEEKYTEIEAGMKEITKDLKGKLLQDL